MPKPPKARRISAFAGKRSAFPIPYVHETGQNRQTQFFLPMSLPQVTNVRYRQPNTVTPNPRPYLQVFCTFHRTRRVSWWGIKDAGLSI